MQNQDIELIFGQGSPQHAVIWLHGLGASSSDFPPIVPELGLHQSRPIRFIFPQAPDRPITVNGGMKMPGWYDIKGTDIADKQDAQGMAESQAMLDGLIQAQIDLGIPSTSIIIAGFSQGGAVIYHTGLRSQHILAGMLAMSTYLPFAEQAAELHDLVNLQTPIFSSHGTFDQMVPIHLGKSSVDALKAMGQNIRWQTYPMEHQVVMEQIKDIGNWINGVFGE
ncbi:MAG: phospholipase/carboxylesterase [Cryomorphaceae bacterium]|jgi:phospholipase/carboxylesterase